MRGVGLALVILSAAGGIAIIRYYSPSQIAARRRARELDEAETQRRRARLLAEENADIDRILGANKEVIEKRQPHDDS